MNEEIKEILDKLSNRKQETLLQGLRECQLKNIEHVFITREEYIDKTLNYINELQQENQQLLSNWNELKEYLKGFDLERLRETCEHNLVDTIEVLLDKMQEIEGKNAQKRHEL